MRSPIEPKQRARRRIPAGVSLWVLGWLSPALLLGAASTAQAVDGRAELRTNHQEGRAGTGSYSSDYLWELFGMDETIAFTRLNSLRLEYTARREILRGSSFGSDVENRLTVLTPGISYSWQFNDVRLSANVQGSRTDREDFGLPPVREDNLQYGLWSTARRDRFRLDFSFQNNTSWRRALGDDRENRDRSGRISARYDITPADQVQYQYSRTDLDAVSLGRRTTFDSHQIQYRGDHGFAADRGRFSLTVLRSRFNQRDLYDAVASQQYVLPNAAGWYIDDTPGQLDPLEPQPLPAPGLIDNDRTSPTVINLGDSAPPGREYGGDYRNILLDFGDLQTMSSATLYVDRRLTFLPQLMVWDLYFCDDPEGFDWGPPVPTSQWSATWFELETGRQGWEITFAGSEVTHRRLKLVNRKSGPTMPDLFVTEFEPYAVALSTQPESTSQQDRTMLNGELSYALHPRLRFRYDASMDRRDVSGEGGRQDRVNNGATLDWRLDGWLVTGQVQVHRESTSGGLDTDSNTRLLSLSSLGRGPFSARMSWMASDEDNYSAKYQTESLTADGTWRAAPALTMTMRASRGRRLSNLDAGDSDSWVLYADIRSAPRPNLRLDLRRTERWVSQEAGVGFTSYSESEAVAGWDIAPQLTWAGQVVRQKRDRDDLIVRNDLSFTPLPGGSVELSFQVSNYQDTRIDQRRRSVGAAVDWRARPRLTFNGGVEKSYETLAGVESWPLSLQFRGYWTF